MDSRVTDSVLPTMSTSGSSTVASVMPNPGAALSSMVASLRSARNCCWPSGAWRLHMKCTQTGPAITAVGSPTMRP
ncbi:hypothetical protein D9M68_892310 [compost metagenome]